MAKEELDEKVEDSIVNEMLTVSSQIKRADDALTVAKLNSALIMLNSALTVLEINKSKALRLYSTAKSLVSGLTS